MPKQQPVQYRFPRPILTRRGESHRLTEKDKQLVSARHARMLARLDEDDLDEQACQVVYITRPSEQTNQSEVIRTELEQKFRRLADQWRRETMLSSSSTDKLYHEAYLKIIGMGEPAIPLILKELEQRGGHWFLALMSITGQDPVSPEDAGRIKKMAEAWIQWGKRNGYL